MTNPRRVRHDSEDRFGDVRVGRNQKQAAKPAIRMLHGDIASTARLVERAQVLGFHSHDDWSACPCSPMTRMFADPRRSLEDIEERIGFCRRTGDSKGLGLWFMTGGQAHFFLGEARPARVHFEECVRLGREVRDDETLRGGLFGLARVAMLVGDVGAAELHAGHAHALAEADGDLDDTATALAFLGDVARVRGEWGDARRLVELAETAARAAGSPLLIARAQYLRGRVRQADGGDAGEAAALFDKSLALGRAAGGPGYHELRCLIGLGWARREVGDAPGATASVTEALDKAHVLGDLQGCAMAYDALSGLASDDGKAEEASTLALRGLELHQRIGEAAAVVSSLEAVATLAVGAGRHSQAGRLLGCAQHARDVHGYARACDEQRRHDAATELLRGHLNAAALDAAWAEGAAMPLEDAAAWVLRGGGRGRGSRDRPALGWDSLTPAERDVVRLVGQGLTNPEVGQRLFISPRTVGHHLTHVYDKLGIRSRHALIRELANHEP